MVMDTRLVSHHTEPENLLGWGYSTLPLIPLRAEPSERSEMLTQVLYGERMLVLEQQSEWSRVQLVDDNYRGWCSTKMITSCTKEAWDAAALSSPRCVTQPISRCLCSGATRYLPAGSRLFPEDSLIDDKKGESMPLLNPSEVAKRFLHAPYLWGGKSILGMDCSGLVQLSFLLTGVMLPRDAGQQVLLGEPLKSVEETIPGDLAFFANQAGKIVHVGLVMDDGCVIHASGSVRIDLLDKEGIFNRDTHAYSHRLFQLRHLSF